MTDLANTGVLVTRPGAGGEELAHMVEAAGGRARLFPALVIEAGDDDAVLPSQCNALPERGLYVFVSPHAVDHAMDWLQRHGLRQHLDDGTVAAVGAGTARRLQHHGCHDIVQPAHGTGSEALLAEARLQHVDGEQVVVFRGQTGAERLAEQLGARGARVCLASVYRRRPPDQALTLELLEGIDIVVVTSSEALANLYDVLHPDARDRFTQLTLLLTSQRAADMAVARGARFSPIITPLVSNARILGSITAWKTSQRPASPR